VNRRRPRAGFPELLVQIGSIIGMTPVEMHLKSFGDELELMPESFGQNAGMSLDIGNLNSKSFSGSADEGGGKGVGSLFS